MCHKCGKPYTNKNRSSKYCSRTCYAASRRGKPAWNKAGVERVCEACGKAFSVSPSATKNGGAKYCSPDCFHKAHGKTMTGRFRKRVAMTCIQCGKPYEVIPSWAATSRYCSRECKHAHQRTLRGDAHPLKKPPARNACLFCGKEYETKPAYASRTRFCSRRCGGSWRAQHIHLPTSIEKAIASLLDGLAIPYEQEKAVGYFLCDFVLEQHRLVIECDGSYWHGLASQKTKDKRKDSWLTNHGYIVLRLPEDRIRNDIAECRRQILSLLR